MTPEWKLQFAVSERWFFCFKATFKRPICTQQLESVEQSSVITSYAQGYGWSRCGYCQRLCWWQRKHLFGKMFKVDFNGIKERDCNENFIHPVLKNFELIYALPVVYRKVVFSREEHLGWYGWSGRVLVRAPPPSLKSIQTAWGRICNVDNTQHPPSRGGRGRGILVGRFSPNTDSFLATAILSATRSLGPTSFSARCTKANSRVKRTGVYTTAPYATAC